MNSDASISAHQSTGPKANIQQNVTVFIEFFFYQYPWMISVLRASY